MKRENADRALEIELSDTSFVVTSDEFVAQGFFFHVRWYYSPDSCITFTY